MQHRRIKTHSWRPFLETLEARRLLAPLWSDFNADGFADLAIGSPGESVNGINSAGAVTVIYGSASGLADANNQFFHEDTAGMADVAEGSDRFGSALAAGDFNGDGFLDLAIGVSGEDIGAVSGAGAIHIVYGSETGLVPNNTYLHQDTPRVREIAEIGDLFGSVLAAGDFNNDGRDDLAVGVHTEDIGTLDSAGMVQVFYGTPVGIKPPGNQTFDRNHPLIDGVASAGDGFGLALSAGDFNKDGFIDLAIGVPGADIATSSDHAGAITILFGSASGISGTDSQWIHEDTPDVPDTAESLDNFGGSLASGDFNNDGFVDLAVGLVQETVGTVNSAGAVITLYGAEKGITGEDSGFFTEDVLGGKNVSETSDRWGRTLAAGDFNGDGFDDVAVACASQDLLGTADVGSVNVLFGSNTGIERDNLLIFQEDLAIGEASELDDHFGETLSAGDYDGDGDTDLVVGTPDEKIGTLVDAGAVYVLYYDGVDLSFAQAWTQNSPGILDSAEDFDAFGGGLVADTKNAPNDSGAGREDFAHLITADVETESILAKTNKRRNSGRR